MFGRKFNVFEKILLPVGIGISFLGFYLVLLAEQANSLLGWMRLLTVFVWMMLLFIVIQSALSEDMKEELSLLQREHVTEIKLLKEIVQDQLQEIKLLRHEMRPSKK